ncbi:FMN-dependent dehydrogenase-domain-containing protein [Ilyonectria destructans]|nr:FMN-dependent dehydrogenase-domain-containing protein [Ilyonectria destructans]
MAERGYGGGCSSCHQARLLISNHGGRKLDGVPATLGALPECTPTAAGKIGIAIDGGIHRTSTVFKANGLSSQHCFVGRVPVLGLAHNGEEEVNLTTRQCIRNSSQRRR